MNLITDNLIIWITGGSRGIGKAIAKKLIQHKAQIILSATSSDSFSEVIKEFSDYDNVFFFPCDIASSASVNKTVNKIRNSIGEIDILINNAGVSVNKLFHELTEEDFDAINNVNYKGMFLTSKSVVKEMIARKSGIIININSIAANETFSKGSIYCASKAAALSMSRNLRNEVREHGIKIIDILPGATETDMWDKENRDKYRERLMQPGDVADAISDVLNLCSLDRMMIEEIILRPQGGNI